MFLEGELKQKSNVHFLHIAKSDKPVSLYSLDVIISVGYRVKSKQGTQFRIWANKTLRQYLLKGYVLNEKLLASEDRFQELNRALNLINEEIRLPQLTGQEKELVGIIADYSKSLRLLEEYDSDTLTAKGDAKSLHSIDYDGAKTMVSELKAELVIRKEADNDLFGHEIDNKLDAAVSGVNQTFDGEDLYPTIEEKAANLLYLITKRHVFSDGNKRIGSILFIKYLSLNQYLYNSQHERKINDNSLAALSLLVANSSRPDKDLIIKIIINLLKG
jgi:prophage maintenance system killer protein